MNPVSSEETMYYKTFDTHKYIKSLQETGFNEKQAEMLVKSLLESRDFDLSILATREQVAKVEAKLQKEIATTREQVSNVKSDLQKEISNVKSDLLKWILPLIIPMFGMMALIIFKMFSNL